jgi:vancomycin resistance protein YoaR
MLLLDDAERVLEESILSSSSTDILLPVAVTKPTIGNDAAEELGIRELLGIGETDFSGSPPNRIHNIRVGAARFNGILVKPGEEFSFNALLGPVGPETGYKPELVIKQDKTVPEYGGGLCQVSTTAFRAAVFSGLPITERRNHAYIVRYYNPPGFDATIYPPHPDLRFINDTEGHILIQTSVSGTKLRFEFYGTSDGRNVEIIGPTVYDKRPDGSAKATLTVRVKGKDGSVREQIFRSTYKPPSLYPVERRNPLE